MENIEAFIEEQALNLAIELDRVDPDYWHSWHASIQAGRLSEEEAIGRLHGGVSGGDEQTFQRVSAILIKQGISVERCYIEKWCMGRASDDGWVQIRSGLPVGAQTAVLLHEWTHLLLHQGFISVFLTIQQKELEAEATAYICTRALGIDYRASAPYIRGIYEGTSEQLLGESLLNIKRAAKRILNALSDSGLL